VVSHINEPEEYAMTAYVVVLASPKDADKMQEYGSAAGKTLASFGGEIAAGGPCKTLYGENPHGRIVVLKFPDTDAANDWYNSDAYQALLPLRKEAMDAVFVLGGE
jgi:uncharacterized protein (DUF1330 family)